MEVSEKPVAPQKAPFGGFFWRKSMIWVCVFFFVSGMVGCSFFLIYVEHPWFPWDFFLWEKLSLFFFGLWVDMGSNFPSVFWETNRENDCSSRRDRGISSATTRGMRLFAGQGLRRDVASPGIQRGILEGGGLCLCVQGGGGGSQTSIISDFLWFRKGFFEGFLKVFLRFCQSFSKVP